MFLIWNVKDKCNRIANSAMKKKTIADLYVVVERKENFSG
jgi:hypothetical protein